MSDAATGSYRSRTAQYRNELLLYLHERGFPSAAATRNVYGSPLVALEEMSDGDICGLLWTIAVRNHANLNLSRAQHEVAAEASRDGSDLYCSIQKRHGYPMGESYCTMPLDVFLRVLAQLHPELVRSQLAPATARAG